MTKRGIHRDLGYLFMGLIISFSISGILLNHRGQWNPTRYTVETSLINYKFPDLDIDRAQVEEMIEDLNIDDRIRRHRVMDSILNVSLVNFDISLDISTGKGELVAYRKTPLISHSYTLHRSTNNWWIYYSDIFGAAMLIIAITGLYMYPKGNSNSFRKRGWKLSVLGILFPLIFLFFLA